MRRDSHELLVPRPEDVVKHCIICDNDYSPKFTSKEEARQAMLSGIATTMDVEQHISGVCSEKCWDTMYPPNECLECGCEDGSHEPDCEEHPVNLIAVVKEK